MRNWYHRFMAWLETMSLTQPYDDLNDEEQEPWP